VMRKSKKSAVIITLTAMTALCIYLYLVQATALSLFLMISIVLPISGFYIGVSMVKRLYNAPLPRGYDWFIPAEKNRQQNGDRDRNKKRSNSSPTLPPYAYAGLKGLRNLHRSKKHWEVVPAAYALVLAILSDWSSLATDVQLKNGNELHDLGNKTRTDSTLMTMVEMLKLRGVTIAKPSKIRELEAIHKKYDRISKEGLMGKPSRLVEHLSQRSIKLITDFVKRPNEE